MKKMTVLVTGASGFTAESLALLFVALAGSTIATLLQKKIGRDIPLMIGTTYQFLIAGIVMLAISIALGRTRFELTHTSFWAMAWLAQFWSWLPTVPSCAPAVAACRWDGQGRNRCSGIGDP